MSSKYGVTSQLTGIDMWMMCFWFGLTDKSLQDVLYHNCVYPDIKFTVGLEQDEALLFMLLDSKQEGRRLWTRC
jgi:hypothetical protein